MYTLHIMFGAPKPPSLENNEEKEKLSNLADRLEEISKKLFPQGDVFIAKFTRRLREDGANSSKVFVSNEFDKFRVYGEDVLALIINELYGGSGSPWRSVEKKLNQDM